MNVGLVTRTFRGIYSCTNTGTAQYFDAACRPSVQRSSNDSLKTFRRTAAFIQYPAVKTVEARPLARLPTSSLLRSLFVGAVFTSPALFRLGFAVLERIVNSRSAILNPDKNPLLRSIIKPFIYDHFCAGTTKSEIQATIAKFRSIGFSGVTLCYGKELELQNPHGPPSAKSNAAVESFDEEIEQWKTCNLDTLGMIGDGDYLAMKFTGAGKAITAALLQGNNPPKQFVDAMDAIAQKAAAQNCRVWVDAEQQVLQQTIDRWAIDFMRQYNRDGRGLIYNTLQSYLKDSRTKLEHQLKLAHKEGWTLAVKLVRGAYISNDIRARIHDTKEETDASYNGIVKDLLSGTLPGVAGENLPSMKLFLAGHNPESITKASDLIRELAGKNALKTLPDFGQLQGMADTLGCKLLQDGEDLQAELRSSAQLVVAPRLYKCLTWGSVKECMQYLMRRAVENHGSTERMQDGMSELSKELKRRVMDGIMGRRYAS